ncbi:MAG: thioredoxin family protein, partial [Acidimicrobiales bacterium]
VLAALAAAVAWYLSRRRGAAPVGTTSWHVPAQLTRTDFEHPETPWLVALFGSSTCEACQAVWERTELLACPDVAVQRLDASSQAKLHQRYRIDAVPLVVIADRNGVVRRHFLGPVSAADLWSAVAELRQPS